MYFHGPGSAPRKFEDISDDGDKKTVYIDDEGHVTASQETEHAEQTEMSWRDKRLQGLLGETATHSPDDAAGRDQQQAPSA